MLTNLATYSGPHDTDGVTRDWPVGWQIMDPTHMVVYRIDEEGVYNEVDPGDYAVQDYVDNPSGGNVEYPISPTPAFAAGQQIIIFRATPFTQPSRFGNQGTFSPKTVELALDHIVRQTQQLDRRVTAVDATIDIAAILAAVAQADAARDAAQAAQAGAETAEDGAVAAQGLAEDARDDAQAAQAGAEAAEATATAAAGTATTQAGIATTQAGIATTQAGIATTQAGNAATSAGTATAQAVIATTQAGIATTQAGNASTSAAAALVSENNADASEAAAAASAAAALTSENNAATSETNAAASAAAALASENNAATSETNAATSEANAATSETNAGNSETAAAASAAAALVSENNADASEAAAAAYATRLEGTSTDSETIGTGTKTFNTQTGKFFDPGIWLIVTSDADPSNYFFGVSTGYAAGVLDIAVTAIGGAGTFADWTIRLSGLQGPVGPAGTLDFTVLTDEAIATGDYLVFGDVSDSSNPKRTTWGDLVTFIQNLIEDGVSAAYDTLAEVETALNAIFTKLNWISVTQAVNLDTMESDIASAKAKTDHISVTQAVDLDAMETKTNFISVTQAVDLDAIETNANNVPGIKTKTDFLTVTQNVDLDAVEGQAALAPTAALIYVIDGAGSVPTTGVKGDLYIPYNCTVVSWALIADASGSAVIDLWMDTLANYPPAVGDTITAAAKPTLSAAAQATGSPTGWITSLVGGRTLRVNLDSVATCKRLTLTLLLTKT